MTERKATKAEDDLEELTQRLATAPIIEVNNDMLCMQNRIEAMMSAQQGLDHDMVQLRREMNDLRDSFKSLAMDTVTHAEQDKVNSKHLELINQAMDKIDKAYALASAERLFREFHFKNFDRVFARLNRPAAVVTIAIIIGVVGCVL